ncbi:MAG: hypothetical protein FRX49_03375 [Trebouxia sp. A1-2]|nr:MAG: hypothetical protein FRX49_03375 [Trebouxia sp. A1-2]
MRQELVTSQQEHTSQELAQSALSSSVESPEMYLQQSTAMPWDLKMSWDSSAIFHTLQLLVTAANNQIPASADATRFLPLLLVAGFFLEALPLGFAIIYRQVYAQTQSGQGPLPSHEQLLW